MTPVLRSEPPFRLFRNQGVQSSLNKNLHVQTATDSGSWFSRVRAAVDIHRVGEDWSIDYEGTVQLAGPETEIGIPTDRWSYLVFVFSSYSFFATGAVPSRMKR